MVNVKNVTKHEQNVLATFLCLRMSYISQEIQRVNSRSSKNSETAKSLTEPFDYKTPPLWGCWSICQKEFL